MSAYYLLLEENALIAEDVRQALLDASGPSRIVHVTTLDAALATVEKNGTPVAAIVNWPYRPLVESALHSLVVEAGGRVIVTRGPGQDDHLVPSGWTRLTTPFGTNHLLDALR